MADVVYTCDANIRIIDILDWTSADAERIILPFKVTDSLLYTAHEIITDATPFTGNQKSPEDLERFTAEVDRVFDTATATATLMLLLYPWNVWAGCRLVINNLADGTEIKKQLPNVLRPWQIRRIADEYFRRGGAGLTDGDRNRWQGYYAEWKKRNPQRSATSETVDTSDDIDVILTQTNGQRDDPDN